MDGNPDVTVEDALRYITASPEPEQGGFHPNTVAAASGALSLISALRARLAEVERERDEATCLVLNHEGAIARLTRERDEARAIRQDFLAKMTLASDLLIDELRDRADRMTREAMAARAWDNETACIIEPLDDRDRTQLAYRAIRAENERHEKGDQS